MTVSRIWGNLLDGQANYRGWNDQNIINSKSRLHREGMIKEDRN